MSIAQQADPICHAVVLQVFVCLAQNTDYVGGTRLAKSSQVVTCRDYHYFSEPDGCKYPSQHARHALAADNVRSPHSSGARIPIGMEK